VRDRIAHRTRHVLQAFRQILFLNGKRHLQNPGKNLPMTELQSFLHGIGGINCRKARVLIAPGGEIAQRRDVDQAPEHVGNGG